MCGADKVALRDVGARARPHSAPRALGAMPAPRFACAALVSGGKDGVLAAMDAARRADARVACLVNLCPRDDDAHELDSHCFQTVAHECVGAFAACAGLDVYRRRIEGRSKALGMAYGDGEEGDEVEDLRAALAAVTRERPDVNSVCSGAILSDYQRLRVEAVCASLGLTSLAPLWRVEQREVLRRVEAEGVDARLVKVAAMGLDPGKHLGMSIADARETLIRVEDEYGSHCAGEGGEFETLVVDCPMFARASLAITETRTVKTSEDRFAPSGHLVIDAFDVVLKENGGEIAPGRVIWVEDDAPRVRASATASTTMEFTAETEGCVAVAGTTCRVHHTIGLVGSILSVSLRAADPASETHETCAEAIFQMMRALVAEKLGEDGATEAWRNVAMTHVYLNDMSQFATVNGVYSRYMPSVAPSARACVATCLPGDAKVQIDCLFILDGGNERKSLHVQSLSSWAPACIGPYGQSIRVNGLAYVAGQIGMEPTTLDLVPGIVAQLDRAMASAVAVADITGAPLGERALAVTFYTSAKYNADYEAEGVHPANVMSASFERVVAQSGRRFLWRPTTTYLTVTDLPKNAVGEIAPTLLVGAGPLGDEEPFEGEETLVRESLRSDSACDWMTSTSVRRPGRFLQCSISVKQPVLSDDELTDGRILARIALHLGEAELTASHVSTCRLYHNLSVDSALSETLASAIRRVYDVPIVVVPVVACGLTPATADDVVIEIFARRHDRHTVL